jgi:hypothetical protein
VGFLRKINGHRQDKVLKINYFKNMKISSRVNSQSIAFFICFMYVEGSRNNEITKNNNNHNNLCLCHLVETCSIIRGLGWYLVTDISGQPIGSHFCRLRRPRRIILDYLTHEVGTDRPSRNVGNQLP